MTSRLAIRTAFEKCLAAVEPKQIVRNKISLSSSYLQLGDAQFPITASTKIVLISFGKASILMAHGARDVLKAPLLRKTLVLAPEQQQESYEASVASNDSGECGESIEVLFGAQNNLPDQNSLSATQKVILTIQDLDAPSTIFLFLISGGGSALLCSPAPSITLSEKLSTIKLLQSKGADVEELNTIRQKLSEVKGGKLLRNVKYGRSVGLLISDVIGDKVEIIASGATVSKETQGPRKSVKEVIERVGIEQNDLEPNVWKVLMEPIEPNEPKKLSDPPKDPNSFQNFIISSNIHALQSASLFLTSNGYTTFTISSSLSGNAAETGKKFADLIVSKDFESELPGFESEVKSTIQKTAYPIALLFGGETTVNLAANPGKGGRNQEMVLSCLEALKTKKPAHQFTFLSAGTDGQDGPTDAAGAVISNSDLLIPSPKSSESLANSDSYNFWKAFNNGASHLITGPSGTNVMDIQILLLDKF